MDVRLGGRGGDVGYSGVSRVCQVPWAPLEGGATWFCEIKKNSPTFQL